MCIRDSIVLPPVTVPVALQSGNNTPAAAAQPNTPAAGGVTGIIIDARGLNARPAMAPRILDQNGSPI